MHIIKLTKTFNIKPVQNQYKTFNHLLIATKSVFKTLYLMAIPTVFLLISSCSDFNHPTPDLNQETELRGDDPVFNPVFSGGEITSLLNLAGAACAEVNYNCIGSSPYTILTFTLPQYPGCTFGVAFIYETCYDPITGQPYAIRFTDFILADVDCPAFVTDFNNAVAANNLANFMFNFNEQVYAKIETYIIVTLQNGGVPIPCVAMGTYKSSCFQYCYGTNSRGNFVLTKKSCGKNACCKREVNYCNGGSGVVTYTVVSEGTCNTLPFVCPGDVINPIVTECLFLCNQ
ncbi:MAG: hypothetical protein IPM42_05230 [Saprospiraceae bacterium]|nr:hypothetical protein [Saprospiraceae bacterium]